MRDATFPPLEAVLRGLQQSTWGPEESGTRGGVISTWGPEESGTRGPEESGTRGHKVIHNSTGEGLQLLRLGLIPFFRLRPDTMFLDMVDVAEALLFLLPWVCLAFIGGATRK